MTIEQAISESIDLREMIATSLENEKKAENEYSYIARSKTTGIIQRAANKNNVIDTDPIIEAVKKKNNKPEENKSEKPKRDLGKQMSLF